MSAGRLDLTGKQGDTFTRLLTFTNTDGSAYNMTGLTLLAQVRDYPGAPGDPAATFTITVGPEAHTRYITLSDDTTAALRAKQYWWDLQWVTSGGETTTKLEGIFTLWPQVSYGG